MYKVYFFGARKNVLYNLYRCHFINFSKTDSGYDFKKKVGTIGLDMSILNNEYNKDANIRESRFIAKHFLKKILNITYFLGHPKDKRPLKIWRLRLL